MKHTEKHETNRNIQLKRASSSRRAWSMEGKCGASGASTFHSRARIYRVFHPDKEVAPNKGVPAQRVSVGTAIKYILSFYVL